MHDDFDRTILDAVDHRPWPLPTTPWVMTQSWHDLLFAHWPVDRADIEAKVPREFPIDEFGGHAWIGIVPFRLTNVAPRGVPSLPWVSAFPELNVRTYVRVADKPGVYFFSLDAGSVAAVAAARTLLNLPYYPASMTVNEGGTPIEYASERTAGGNAGFRATYQPNGTPGIAAAGSLEYFLTERYCLYNLDHRGRPYRLDIHHRPWLLCGAEASIAFNSMASANGFTLPGSDPLLHFVRRQDMVAWVPELLDQ